MHSCPLVAQKQCWEPVMGLSARQNCAKQLFQMWQGAGVPKSSPVRSSSVLLSSKSRTLFAALPSPGSGKGFGLGSPFGRSQSSHKAPLPYTWARLTPPFPCQQGSFQSHSQAFLTCFVHEMTNPAVLQICCVPQNASSYFCVGLNIVLICATANQ